MGELREESKGALLSASRTDVQWMTRKLFGGIRNNQSGYYTDPLRLLLLLLLNFHVTFGRLRGVRGGWGRTEKALLGPIH